MSAGPTILYSMARFPKLSETFVLDEMINLERLGARVVVIPLIHQVEDAKHPEAVEYEQRANYCRPWDRRVLAANLRWLSRAPGRYVSTFATLVWGMKGSREFLPKSLAAFLQAAWFAEIAGAEGATHQHAQFATHATTSVWVVWRLTGIPFSFTSHAHDTYVDRTFLDRKLRDARFAVPTSHYLRRILAAIEPSAADRLHVIRTGIDTTRFDPAHRAPRERFTLVNVARLDVMKGQTFLLATLRGLLDRGIDVDLRIVGDGELRPEIEAEIRRLRLGDHVVLLGNQPREVVVEEIHAAHIAVSSSIVKSNSDTEGLPISLIESMAAGVPTVATRVAGVPELIEDGVSGLVVDHSDAAALTDAVARVHDDPALAQRLGEGGRQRVLDQFDERATAAALLALIEHTAGATT